VEPPSGGLISLGQCLRGHHTLPTPPAMGTGHEAVVGLEGLCDIQQSCQGRNLWAVLSLDRTSN
jgi:hypothetical protein